MGRKYTFTELKEIAEKSVKSYPKEDFLASLSPDEVAKINQRLLEIAPNERVFELLWNAREYIYDAVRAVKAKVGRPFNGIEAEGDELDLRIILPKDITRGGSALSSWSGSVTAGEATFADEVTLNEDEAYVFVGVANGSVSEAVGYVLSTKPLYVRLPWDLADPDFKLIAHKPVKINPKETFSIKVWYSADGTDATALVGVKVSKAKNFAP